MQVTGDFSPESTEARSATTFSSTEINSCHSRILYPVKKKNKFYKMKVKFRHSQMKEIRICRDLS